MDNNLEIAIKHFGSQTKLADALDVSPMVVYQWTKRKIPTDRAFQIERVSDGLVKVSDLRPDLFSGAA